MKQKTYAEACARSRDVSGLPSKPGLVREFARFTQPYFAGNSWYFHGENQCLIVNFINISMENADRMMPGRKFGPWFDHIWSHSHPFNDLGILSKSYWCSVGNGWEWGNGMISDSYCGSFPHSLLSTSKKLYTHHKAWSSPLDHHNFIPSGGHHTVWGCWGKSVLKPQKTGQPPNAYCNSYINKLWIVYDSYVILGIRSCFAPAVIQVMQDQSDLNWKVKGQLKLPSVRHQPCPWSSEINQEYHARNSTLQAKQSSHL